MDFIKRVSGFLRLCLLACMAFWSSAEADSEQQINVGIYDNRSLLFLSEGGEAEGFFPEILGIIAERENWQLHYQPCVWAKCLQMLDDGRIDLLPAVAFSEARAQRFAFNQQSLLLNWGVVYHVRDKDIDQIFDLRDQRIGVLRGDIYNEGLRELSAKFNVPIEWVEFDIYSDIVDAMIARNIDAGVVNRVYEALDERMLNLHRTSVIFTPVELHFAASPKWQQANKYLANIDKNVAKLKADNTSAYHHAVHRWFGGLPGFRVPPWLKTALLVLIALLAAAAVVLFWLRYEVARRTAALARSENRFRQLYEGSPTLLCKLDGQRCVLSINEYGAQLLGYQPSELIGKPATALLLSESRYSIDQFIGENPNPVEGAVRRFDVRVLRKDGSDFPMRLIGRWQLDEEHGMTLTMVGEDSSDNARLTEELAFRVAHDPLTGLPNRREFMARMSRALEDEDGPQHALIYLDLDAFRLINDNYGHAFGDRVLVEVAHVLRGFVKRADLVARLSGDEFGLLILNCDQDCATSVSERLLTALHEELTVQPDAGFRLRACLGAAFWEKGQSLSSTLANAETAATHAKRQGGNRVRIFSHEDDEFAEVSEEARWVHRINRAMAEGQLELFGQAIQPLAQATPGIRFEFLLRLRSETGEIVPPGRFLPALERHHHITDVDCWVVSKAFQWVSENDRDDLKLVTINLSGQSLSAPNFEPHVMEQIQRFAPPMHKICFEITETAAIENLAAASSLMERLRRVGFVFALDDFGAGLSSFSYLRNLPLRYVKLDGQFVREALRSPVDRTLIRAVHDVARSMGIETIAEFAENSDTIELLRNLNVDYAQGYAIGMPKPLNEF